MKEAPHIKHIRGLDMDRRLIHAYETLRSKLVKWLYRHFRTTWDDAEDVAARAWLELTGYVRNRVLRKWTDGLVFKIARHRMIDHLEAVRRRREVPLSDLLPGEGLERVETGIAISQLLGTIPEDERTVIECAYLDGCTLAETADLIRVSVATVKRLRSRALAGMRGKVDTSTSSK